MRWVGGKPLFGFRTKTCKKLMDSTTYLFWNLDGRKILMTAQHVCLIDKNQHGFCCDGINRVEMLPDCVRGKDFEGWLRLHKVIRMLPRPPHEWILVALEEGDRPGHRHKHTSSHSLAMWCFVLPQELQGGLPTRRTLDLPNHELNKLLLFLN